MKNKVKIISIIVAIFAVLAGAIAYRYRHEIIDMLKVVNCKTGKSETNDFESFFHCNLSPRSVVIFEPNPYHHECIPGYAKYFTDLGYSVDILLIKDNEDSMCLFEPDEKLRIFLYDSLEQISNDKKVCEKLKNRFNKYDFVFVNTTDPGKKDIYSALGLLQNKNSLFVAHDINFVKYDMNMEEFFNENRVISLGNFASSGSVYVNPHYFGKVIEKNKNKKTRFFITSTKGKKYDYLIDAVKQLNKEKLDFEIVVVGRNQTLSEKTVPAEIKNKFIFKGSVSYKEMYKQVNESDYIIVIFDPENPEDEPFKNLRVTGSSQLSYGFLKPSIMHSEFAGNYSMTNENSILYNNKTLEEALRKAIKSSDSEYKEMQENLLKLKENIYKLSLENLKKAMKYSLW